LKTTRERKGSHENLYENDFYRFSKPGMIMRRFVGFLMCTPLLFLIALVAYWAITSETVQTAVVRYVCVGIGIVSGVAIIAIFLFGLSLAAQGLKMLFGKGNK
jgi:hypothetical protein